MLQTVHNRVALFEGVTRIMMKKDSRTEEMLDRLVPAQSHSP